MWGTLGATPCYLLAMLTCALLMTSSHSEGPTYDSLFMADSVWNLDQFLAEFGSTPVVAGEIPYAERYES